MKREIEKHLIIEEKATDRSQTRFHQHLIIELINNNQVPVGISPTVHHR